MQIYKKVFINKNLFFIFIRKEFLEQTFKYKIKKVDNLDLFEKQIYNYTGLFYKMYNNLELSEDIGFINECKKSFNIDKTIYEYCLVDVKMQWDSFEEIKKDKEKKIEDINK